MDSPLASEGVCAFGPFELHTAQRRLLRSGEAVRLGSRAMDILIALVARAGEVVTKADLMATVWPDTFVDESNLRVHMTALRRALGDDQTSTRFIESVPGRGYCFVATVRRALPPDQPKAPRSGKPINNLPRLLGRMIGREDVLEALPPQVIERRLLTITGPGGIGKTTVALGVAERLAREFRDGVAYLDLSPVSDPKFLVSLLASVLGHATRAEDPLRELAAFLQDRRMLIVLDSCEHMIDAAAMLAETLLRQAPELNVLATSREPLRAEGEWVYRLASLDFPPASDVDSAEELLQFPAVQLFVQEASSALGGYQLSRADAPFVAEICRRLDGIALAIELAAGWVDTIGVEALAASLDDVFRVLTRGRRTALPRHQTLKATLDWSYHLLSPREQVLLRRLAAFAGHFGIDAVRVIASDEALDCRTIDGDLASLVAKSLISTDGGGTLRYRLLDTTRAYAREKLDESGETRVTARRHAEYFRVLFEHAKADWETRPAADWLSDYGRHLSNLRAAIAWAFSPGGDARIGAALTVAAVPLWFQLSLVDECIEQVQRSLSWITQSAPDEKAQLMQLYAVLGWPQLRSIAGFPSGAAAWQKVLELAEELGDQDYRLRALWALWVDRTNSGEWHAAQVLAERFACVASESGDPADACLADRVRAKSLHFIGDQEGALRHITRMLDHYVPPSKRSHTTRFQYDQKIIGSTTLARALWLRGFPEQALRVIEENVTEALSLGHVLTLTNVLADAACPVALHAGDLALADRYTAMLHRYTTDHALDVWRTYADSFRAQMMIRAGERRAGLDKLRAAIEALERGGFVLLRVPFLGTLAEGLSADGKHGAALATVDRALGICQATGEGWAVAELHRVRAEIVLAQAGAGAAADAERQLRRALAVAREQEALSWELRAATSMARLLLQQGRGGDSLDILAPVLGKFTEGYGMPDLLAADAVLKQAKGLEPSPPAD